MTTPLKARALLFGLNYSGTGNDLQGCINDVINMSTYLASFGIPCKVCTDEKNGPDTTAMGMMHNLYELAIQTHKENLDFVYIHYSGHGTSVLDMSRDEKDMMDEALVPRDFAKAGLIVDDVIESLMNGFNPRTRVVFVFDCCHSGTIGDIKYKWVSDTKCTVENILCDVQSRVITISGCRDDQVSADAPNVLGDNKFSGALTSSLLNVLKRNPSLKQDVFKLVQVLRKELDTAGFDQVPQLCSTHNLAKDKVLFPF
jgi:hypothetical protein